MFAAEACKILPSYLIALIGGEVYLSSRTADAEASMLVSVRRGLGDVGYAEGRNVAIEYRFADGRYDRLSAQLTDLTQRKVAVIVFAGFVAIEELVEQVRASLIPIIFGIGADPVRFGLVARINRPGGNVTGFNALVSELSGKQLGLLHDLVPRAATIAVLSDPRTRSQANRLQDARDATAALGQKLLVLEASTADEIDAQFARLDREPADAMLVASSPFFVTRAGADRGTRGTPSHPRNLRPARVCRSRRAHQLWV